MKHRFEFGSLLSAVVLCATLSSMVPAHSQVVLPRPQVVFAIGNSESMDGTLSGAIMTGSGMYASDSGLGSLGLSSSPTHYLVPEGFTPPKQAADASGNALYTVKSGSTYYDNGASRLNVAKAGILSTLQEYMGSMDFALTAYETSRTAKYTTWAYHMSLAGGFTFTSTPAAGSRYVNNPCYQPTGSTLSSTIATACSSIASTLYGGTSRVYPYKYMVIQSSADDANINDVLYSGNLRDLWVNYGRVTGNGQVMPPATPYSAFGLEAYKRGGAAVQVTYGSAVPSGSTATSTNPTNAGYVPYSPQTLYVKRGFGYGGSQTADAASTLVSMTSLGLNPTAAAVNTAINNFQPKLAPETDNVSTSEIKAVAGQAATAGLIKGTGAMLQRLAAPCTGQYIILVTDGLPTLSIDDKSWPPLGSEAGGGYGVYATFAGIPANSAYGIRDGTRHTGVELGSLVTGPNVTNNDALQDTIDQISALYRSDRKIKTYVVGLGAGVDATKNPAANAALNAMAIAGGTGQQYPANDIPSFQAALKAIAAQIYGSTQITAPVAPGTVTSGTKIYVATSKNQSGHIGGHLQAYNSGTVVGQVQGAALWDAGSDANMSTRTRKDKLFTGSSAAYGSGVGSATLVKFADMGNPTHAAYDAAAFGLPFATAQTCVPNAQTVVAYTLNPSYNAAGDNNSTGAGFPVGIAGCDYRVGRELNWMLDSMSPNNDVKFVNAPGSATLLSYPGYTKFAKNNQNRTQQVVLTSNDGIMYGIHANTGAMLWGWMPRPFVSHLYQYTTRASKQLFDGKFSVVDAVNTSSAPTESNWASYVVGTAEGGAYHYALKLSSNTNSSSTNAATPVGQTWGVRVAGGSSPQMQAPVVVNRAGMQYALFVVNTTNNVGVTSSTLYEVNVATGTANGGGALSGALPFVASSALSYDASTGTLWLGDKEGKLWSLNITGAASADVRSAYHAGTMTPALPLKWVGYGQADGLPYVWGVTLNQVSVFSLANGSNYVAWATRGGASPQGFGANMTISIKVKKLREKAQVSDAPVLANGTLLIPEYVPPAENSCVAGNAYYALHDLASGGLPRTEFTYGARVVENGEIYIGAGFAFSPTFHGDPTGGGLIGLPGTSSPDPGSGSGTQPIATKGAPLSRSLLWRQR